MQSRRRWGTFSKQWTYVAKTATTMRTSKKIRTLHSYHIFLRISLPSLHDYEVTFPNFTRSVSIQQQNNSPTFDNVNETEPKRWSLKLTIQVKFSLPFLSWLRHNQQNQAAQTLQVLSATKIKQNHYQLNPSLEPKRGNSTTEKVWIVYSKDYRLDFRRPLGSGEECGLISRTAAGNRVDVFI